MVPIFQKGKRRVCSNYKGITMLNLPGKVYGGVVEGKVHSLVSLSSQGYLRLWVWPKSACVLWTGVKVSSSWWRESWWKWNSQFSSLCPFSNLWSYVMIRAAEIIFSERLLASPLEREGKKFSHSSGAQNSVCSQWISYPNLAFLKVKKCSPTPTHVNYILQ